jgi:hypothetical protein
VSMPCGNTAALLAYEASEIVINEYDRKIACEDVKDWMIQDDTDKTFDAFLDKGGLIEWLEIADRRRIIAAMKKDDHKQIGGVFMNALKRYIDAYLDGDGAYLVDAEAAQQASEMS